jgi:preprotein translocase subunit SecB
MTDTPAGPNGGGEPDAAAAQQAPRLSILTQYVKDLSFENPRAPYGLQAGQARPEIQIQVDVRASQIGEGQYEVVLDLNVDAKAGENQVFLVELAYGGVFTLANIPSDSLQPLLLIECPRLLFPFARRVVADATRDGGFPPLMIDPIDFAALFRRRVQQGAETAQA